MVFVIFIFHVTKIPNMWQLAKISLTFVEVQTIQCLPMKGLSKSPVYAHWRCYSEQLIAPPTLCHIIRSGKLNSVSHTQFNRVVPCG